MDLYSLVVNPFILSFFIVLILTPVVIFVFKKFGFVIDSTKKDHPAHTHQGKTPKGGGIATVVAVTISAAFFLKWDIHLWGIFLGLWLSLIVGIVDDITNKLNPYIRLLSNILAAMMVVGVGIGISFISNPIGGGVIDLSNPRIVFEFLGNTHEIWILADIFAILWIPFIMNSINWSSGVDGQVSGVIFVAAVVIGILSLSYSADITQWPVSILAFSLAGAFAAFSIYHFYPQKIMPGYSGASTAGFLLAVLAILSTAKVGTVFVVLGIPIIDALYLIIRRTLSGKSPVWGDRGHLHHKLLDLGWGKRRIAIFYGVITLFLGAIALGVGARFKLFAILTLALLMIMFFLWNYLYLYSKQ
jgi:UDP-GlcNAc:undecaprenyl-phosphate/decaprenyl-phosphate GlcNAc-1-phosphate transferase